MTKMCRSLGIPSRVAVGFVTDPESAVLGFVPVRSDQAHAWVEIWLDDYGWIEFDPTSQTMAPGEEYPFQFINPDQWLPLVEEVLARSGEVSLELMEEDNELEERWWHAAVSTFRAHLYWIWILAAVLLICLYLPGRIIPALKYLSARKSSDLRKRAVAKWRYASLALIRSGRGPLQNETALVWSRRQSSNGLEGFDLWTDLYLKAVFGPVFDIGDMEAADTAGADTLAILQALSWQSRLAILFGPGWRGRLPW